MRRFRFLIILLGAVCCWPTFAAYQLVLDTSSFQGISAIVTYDLVDGTPGSSRIKLAAPLVDGVTFGNEEYLADVYFYNSVSQPVVLGSLLTLEFDLSQGGIFSPGYFPDSFALFLLNESGLPFFPTSDPTGANSLVQWDLGVSAPTVFAGRLQEDSNSVSLPNTLALVLTALVGLLWKPHRARSVLVGSGLVLSTSLAVGAPSLQLSTDLGGQTQLSVSGLRLNRQTNTFDSTLTIRNISSQQVDRPFTVAVLDLPAGIILSNATGVALEGVPLITVEGDAPVPPSGTVWVTLKFVNRTNSAFPIALRLVRLDQPVPQAELIQGPDFDANGVRDDLDPILDSRYDSNPELRSAATAVLASMRAGLVASGSVEGAFNAMLRIHRAFDCLASVDRGDPDLKELEFLRDHMMNSRERVAAWIALTDKVAGQSVPIGTVEPCTAQ